MGKSGEHQMKMDKETRELIESLYREIEELGTCKCCGSCHNMIYSDEERREIHQRFKGNHPKVTKPKPKGLNTLKFIGLNRKVN